MGAGEPSLKHGMAIYAYSANVSMTKTAFYEELFVFILTNKTEYAQHTQGILLNNTPLDTNN